MTRANILLYLGLTLIVAGLSCYDWRAGLVASGVLSGSAGILLALR